MDAIKEILKSLNPLDILNYYGFKEIVETETEIRACCEIHKGNNPSAFAWNKENNLWFCHTGDCNGGDIFTLIEKIEGVGFVESVKRAASILNLDIDDMEITIQTDRIKKENLKWIENQSKKFRGKRMLTYELSNMESTSENNNFTRFKPSTVEHFEGRFYKRYEDVYNKLAIPIKHNKDVVGVALRTLKQDTYPKWFYQPKDLQIGKILYNLDNALPYIFEANEVILVEGAFDVWAYYESGIKNVVAIFGSALKKEQYKQLLKLSVTVSLSFDNDNAGNMCTKDVISKLNKKTDIKLIQLPKDKDPADCTHSELMNSYLTRTKVQE